MQVSRRAFTLVELLIVIVIMGVMAVLVGPSFSTGSDYARLKSASRGVVQLSRYSKTMALLHQTPVDLVYSSDGKLSVESAGSSGDSLVSSDSFARSSIVDDADGEAEDIETPPVKEGESESFSGGGSTYVMAELNIEKEYKQITYRFEGYTDTIEGGNEAGNISSFGSFHNEDDDDPEAPTSFRVHYKSNGTCRPYRVRVIAGGDESTFKLISVNMLGAAKVEEEDEF
ncbi:MAG: prepilin-type N-terminal cleavage/methylation domain-containing protein [Kiritimatiellae bacterium]|jgi:prepilin-type N-terminal cleavage/methylation domain-containing protein|nr:prepilin-type N-terminal cleavage/methylation domain-containing protein [Kiritimatiellia bacterium]